MAFIKSGKEIDKVAEDQKLRRRYRKLTKVTFNVPDKIMRKFKRKLITDRKTQTQAINDMILKYLEIPDTEIR